MGNQSSVQCEHVCCDGDNYTNAGGPKSSVTSYPLFGDDRAHLVVSDLPDLSAPERARAAAHPLMSPDKDAAASNVFGVVAAEGDSVSAAEIASAPKRLAESIAGTDKSLQRPAVKLVRKEWQHMA